MLGYRHETGTVSKHEGHFQESEGHREENSCQVLPSYMHHLIFTREEERKPGGHAQRHLLSPTWGTWQP